MLVIFVPSSLRLCNQIRGRNLQRLQSGKIKLSSFRKQHYSFISKLLLKKTIQVTWHSASITASIRIRNWEHVFSTSAGGSSANTRRMAAIRLALVLWEFMFVMFSTYDQTKQSSGLRSGEEGVSERRAQSRSSPSEAKPGSLWTCGPAPSPRVCHRPPDWDHHILQHIQVHFGVDF